LGSLGLMLRLTGALATVSGTRENAWPARTVSQPRPGCDPPESNSIAL